MVFDAGLWAEGGEGGGGQEGGGGGGVWDEVFLKGGGGCERERERGRGLLSPRLYDCIVDALKRVCWYNVEIVHLGAWSLGLRALGAGIELHACLILMAGHRHQLRKERASKKAKRWLLRLIISVCKKISVDATPNTAGFHGQCIRDHPCSFRVRNKGVQKQMSVKADLAIVYFLPLFSTKASYMYIKPLSHRLAGCKIQG